MTQELNCLFGTRHGLKQIPLSHMRLSTCPAPRNKSTPALPSACGLIPRAGGHVCNVHTWACVPKVAARYIAVFFDMSARYLAVMSACRDDTNKREQFRKCFRISRETLTHDREVSHGHVAHDRELPRGHVQLAREISRGRVPGPYFKTPHPAWSCTFPVFWFGEGSHQKLPAGMPQSRRMKIN